MKTKRKNQVLQALTAFWPEARTVVDAQHRLVIHVESVDQESGAPGKPQECALARACVREQGIDGVLIFKKTAYLRQGTHVTRFLVPESVTREIVSFDRAGSFAPGTYHLSAPSKSKRLGYHSKHPTGKSDGSRKRLEPVHLRTVGTRTGLLRTRR